MSFERLTIFYPVSYSSFAGRNIQDQESGKWQLLIPWRSCIYISCHLSCTSCSSSLSLLYGTGLTTTYLFPFYLVFSCLRILCLYYWGSDFLSLFYFENLNLIFFLDYRLTLDLGLILLSEAVSRKDLFSIFIHKNSFWFIIYYRAVYRAVHSGSLSDSLFSIHPRTTLLWTSLPLDGLWTGLTQLPQLL